MGGRGQKAARILIIDDSAALRLALRTFLEDHGFQGMCASGAAEGLELIRRERPDIILLDVMLEKPYSGFHVCAQVKEDPALRHIPVIGMSGMGDQLGITYSLETDRGFFNPDAYLEKPINLDALLERVRGLLSP
jgi:DNA-binding response OmpR family regulator